TRRLSLEKLTDQSLGRLGKIPSPLRNIGSMRAGFQCREPKVPAPRCPPDMYGWGIYPLSQISEISKAAFAIRWRRMRATSREGESCSDDGAWDRSRCCSLRLGRAQRMI